MDAFWESTLVKTAGNYSVAILCLVLFLFLFEIVTKYDNWKGIKDGNVAIAMATGGKVFGIANVFRHSIAHNDTLFVTIGWGFFGFVLLMISYFIFEFLTPKFNVDEEISKDNRAVGFISMVISIGLSYVIGASIS